MILRLAIAALLAFMTVPTAVVSTVSFNPTAILSFPPAGLSLRWYENVLTYPQFQRAAVNSLVVTGGAVALALPIGTLAALALERGRLRTGICGRPPCSPRSSFPASRPAWASSWPPPSASCGVAPSSSPPT